MCLDVRSKGNADLFTHGYHLITVPLHNGTIDDCSWYWDLVEAFPDSPIAQTVHGGLIYLAVEIYDEFRRLLVSTSTGCSRDVKACELEKMKPSARLFMSC